jgi:hypothetical protein
MHTIGLCHSLRAGDENEPQTLWISEELVEKCAGESAKVCSEILRNDVHTPAAAIIITHYF